MIRRRDAAKGVEGTRYQESMRTHGAGKKGNSWQLKWIEKWVPTGLMHAALHRPAAGNQGCKGCLMRGMQRQTLAFMSLSAGPVLATASQHLLHMHTASSWLELPPFPPCTNFMPFKLCWQRTWLFLLTAAASSGLTLLFPEKPVFPKTSRANSVEMPGL